MAGVNSLLSYYSATCNITNLPVPVTYEIGSMSFDNQSLDVTRWNASVDNGTFVHGNSQIIISDDSKLDNPACVNRCCVFDTQWRDTISGAVGNWIGVCQAWRGLTLMPGGAETEPYDNVYHLKAEPSPECPEGSAMTTFQPNVVYVESLSAGTDIIRFRYYAFVIADAPDASTWSTWQGQYKIGPVSSAIMHDFSWYRYRTLKHMIAWKDLPDADNNPDVDDDPNVLTETAALAMLFATSVAIMTQPRGSIFHSWHVPLFWRLVPGYAVLETLVVLLLTILVSLRTRTFKSVIVAILVYRDPKYLASRRLPVRHIVDAVLQAPGFYQSRSVALFTTLPFVFLFVKIFVVEGAVFLSSVCLLYAVPWVVLQAIVLCMPKRFPDDDVFRNQIKTAVEDIKHVGRLINSEIPQRGEPDALLNAQLMTPDIVADLTVCLFSNSILLGFSFSQGKLLAIQAVSNFTETVALETLCSQAAFFFGMMLWFSVSFFSLLGLFIHFGLLGEWLGRLVRVHERAVRLFFLRLIDALHLGLWGAAIIHSLMTHEPGETYRPPWFERMPS